MGSPDARAYSRNKRGIAGSLIWINFDRHALLDLVKQCGGTFVADIDEIRPGFTNTTGGGAVFQSSVVRGPGASAAASATISALNTTLTSAGQNSQMASPWYSDQVVPFDVTLSGANEYGAMCAAKIFGLEILNEGMGISIDDAVTEMQIYLKPGPPLVFPCSPPSRSAPGNSLMMPLTHPKAAIYPIFISGSSLATSRRRIKLCSRLEKLRYLDLALFSWSRNRATWFLLLQKLRYLDLLLDLVFGFFSIAFTPMSLLSLLSVSGKDKMLPGRGISIR
jgi:hypothetical protein